LGGTPTKKQSELTMLKIKQVENQPRKYAEFIDGWKQPCSIVESSAVEPSVWLGVEEKQMHLTVQNVRDLLPLLETFVKTGFIK
jgi:predicted homoserine dehydrogenase-like protein